MHKKIEKGIQLHKKRKKHLCVTRFLMGIMIAVLVVSLFPIGRLQVQAAGGTITTSDSTFWSDIYVPNDLEIKQAISWGQTNISIPYQSGGIFKPSITVNVTNNRTQTGSNNTWTSTGSTATTRYFSYVYTSAKDAIIYYRVNNTSNTNMGTVLLDYYRAYYSPSAYKKSSDMMATTEERGGKTFVSVAESCANNSNWIKYDNQGINLTQNGSQVNKIEMLILTPVDYWFKSCLSTDSTSYQSKDLDLMLYSTVTYNFTYSQKTISPPTVKTESGSALTPSTSHTISADDMIILENNDSDETSQYCLSASEITDNSQIKWSNYTSPISLGGKQYLYVRKIYNKNQYYLESSIQKYTFSYMESSSAIVHSTPSSGSYLDVGDSVQLEQSGGATASGIYYTVKYDPNTAQTPTLSRVSDSVRKQLNLDGNGPTGYYQFEGNVYIKVNGLWYKCNDGTVQKYEGPITTIEELRTNNGMWIYAFVADEGKELGNFQQLQYSYGMKNQTNAPTVTVATSPSQPTEVKMGSKIGLLCDTIGSKIFYTTNGSAPVIQFDNTTGAPKAGANTFEYSDATPIVVSDQIANYGQSFLIMAQAVTYTKSGDQYYPTHKDSPIAKFNYKVANQKAVEPVQSIPATNADKPVEVTVGSKVQLFSDTENVTIFYTIDGSEPIFDETTLTPGTNTFKYSGATGVEVTRTGDSSLFTITAVAYQQGLAVSDICRLVFAYPGAVTSPYANPASGAVAENTQVVLKTATEKAVIHYEIAYGDAIPSDPTSSSKVFDEVMPISITKKTTIKAIAIKNTMESAIATFTYTVSDKLKVPTPSIATGTVVAPGTVINLSADSGATIYYTLDGSNPKDAANKKVQVGNKVVLNGEPGAVMVLRTYAVKDGYSSSDEGSFSYSISTYAGGIYADRETGEILKNGETVSLHTDMSDATIYYTTDGSTPTENSRSGNLVTIQGQPGEQITVMAMAVAKGSEKTTSFATFTYTIMNQLAAPTASVPDGAVFTRESVVELKAESGRIYYTTDGSEPSDRSNLYRKSIVIDRAVTIKAIAVADDLEQSEISTFVYGFAEQVATPLASYASGELEMGTKVSFSCATEGATIYYRTDGGEINLSRKSELEIYTEPITVNKATNFKVIAVMDKMQDSKVLTVGYTVREPVVIEPPEEEGSQFQEGQSNRLQSRRSFSEADAGPSYTDVVLRNANYGAIVAAQEDVLPEAVKLDVTAANVTDAVERRVKQVISESFGVVASYDVKLLVNGEETQPDGTIEIGLPIPVEYENAMLYIAHVQEDGNIELYETRRSGGIAYAKVDHLSVYSIAAPVEFTEEKTTFPWLPVIYTAAVSVTGLGIWMINKARKAKREEGMRND